MNEEDIHENRFSDKKLIDYGFRLKNGKYVLVRDILDGQLTVNVTVENGGLTLLTTDSYDGSEYTLHLAQNADGPFVNSVRYEIDGLLRDIEINCNFSDSSYKDQKDFVVKYCLSKYGDVFEYLWETSPDAAAIRRKDNQKWYGVLMKISSEKLGITPERDVNVLNLHVNSDELASLVLNEGIFPAYHMSKKHWITVVLDGSVTTEKLTSLIDSSYVLGAKKQKTTKRSD